MIKHDCIIFLNDSNFDTIIQNKEDSRLFLIDFWAEWCNPCKIFASIFEEIAFEYYIKMQFGKLNVDENPLIVKKYNIRSIPTLLLFRNGVLLFTKIGMLSKKEIQEFLNENL